MYPARHLFGLAILAAALHAQTAAPPEAPAPMQVTGTFRYLHHGLFKVYEAELLAPAGTRPETILAADCPFELRLTYLRDIQKNTILKSANRMLEKNLDPAILGQISKRVARLHRTYEDIKRGNRAVLRYHPQAGTTFFFNDKPRTTIPGKDFAKYYFQIWLGAKPVSPAMREALLGH